MYTDNNPLTYLMRSSNLPAVEQIWAAALAPFNFEIKYRSAKHNANADALSRLTPAAMVSSHVDSCFEELTRTTKLPTEMRVNVVEAREQAPAIVSDSIGTLPLVLVRYQKYRSIAILAKVRYRYLVVSRYFDNLVSNAHCSIPSILSIPTIPSIPTIYLRYTYDIPTIYLRYLRYLSLDIESIRRS